MLKGPWRSCKEKERHWIAQGVKQKPQKHTFSVPSPDGGAYSSGRSKMQNAIGLRISWSGRNHSSSRRSRIPIWTGKGNVPDGG